MSLLLKIIDQVSIEARQNGVKCKSRGEAQILQHNARWIEALVACPNPHRVALAYEPGVLEFSCDCDAYRDNAHVCQHVWATLLTAETLGYMDEWNHPGAVALWPTDELKSQEQAMPSIRQAGKSANQKTRKGQGGHAAWKHNFEALREVMTPTPFVPEYGQKTWTPARELIYVLDREATRAAEDGLLLDLMARERKKDGTWGKLKNEALSLEDVNNLPNAGDQEIIALLTGAARSESYGLYYSYQNYRTHRYKLKEAQYKTLVKYMCQTGRCMLRLQFSDTDEQLIPITWNDEDRWRFVLTIARDEAKRRFVLTGELRSGEKRLPLDDTLLVMNGGLVFAANWAARLEEGQAFAWILLLRMQGSISVPAAQADELLEELLTLPQLPELELPEDLRFERQVAVPRPKLVIKKPKEKSSVGYYYSPPKPKLTGHVFFEYDGQVIEADEASAGVYRKEQHRLIERNAEAERAARERLFALGFKMSKPNYYNNHESQLELAPTHLPNVVRKLVEEKWIVEADGSLYRQAGNFNLEISSGIDWFELHGKADFDGQSVDLPELLRALRKGEKTVRLDDGTFGVLPEQWLQKYGLLAGMGKEEDDHVRFGKTQIGLLDALLAAQPEINTDAVFEQARSRLRDFSGVKASDPPATFVGTLRPYQREGLGWLEFLRRFGFGGCLADDMGLGKTVQVLALLEERRLLRAGEHAPGVNGNSAAVAGGDPINGSQNARSDNGGGNSVSAETNEKNNPAPLLAEQDQEKPNGPSLVVAPRSLVFNWREEAARFAPNLRVLDHTGAMRVKDAANFANYDLILTTYGTMRNDIAFVKDVKFDYVVLDEAQAVKNANSESAKAARLLGGTHRLALSGTPVQNHLGELWSLFEFLNPGMLGSASAFQAGGAGARTVDESARALLSRALRPFILRRTKGQVAKELPQRVEQTIHCELDGAQRKLYDELKEHYRRSLLSKIEAEGIAKNKIQVLEALLRLRQAACHPGLLDKTRVLESSAKLDSLFPQLSEVNDGGHKALVFSQFTSFLSIVRRRLDKEKVNYAYLDGRTRDRQEAVRQFQEDEKCKLFLISLKAGGVGLNLTSAEYVFLLDPWWNPAVEAQAIDRAHRIGQTRQVFAYRLIAKDTVEEKVLQLQATKRELADAIINADNSLISKLGRQDLELLLS